ncbi:hypothetical protein O7627_09225 [Solwaraspora sp. WMMD1047]|uniref:hypothetical protein n=1 Tax=Solwaraspora sp. WMMD1047 TaxID=3016102 RepID=UPI002417DB0B|nr:hypothetical protein [Solwaraspora sp. WMMD1047]MDG4829482.1 hypothetical protein [Solwaraspora sp. WMMD1047]
MTGTTTQAYDAAWVVEHSIDELREAYAQLGLAVERVRAIAAGSTHPLPARALATWGDALALTGPAGNHLAGGIDELRALPGIAPLTSMGDLVAALTTVADQVRRTTTGVVRVRERVEAATATLTGEPGPAVRAALGRWRLAIGVLDEVIGRVQLGVVALSAYADGIVGVDPQPARGRRVLAVLARSRHPGASVGDGAELAGALVRRAAERVAGDRAPHLRVPWRRRVGWLLRRGYGPAVGWRLLGGGRRDRTFYAHCLDALQNLSKGNTFRYADRIGLLRHGEALCGYADALAAATVLAVERRFAPAPPERSTVATVVQRLHLRYDGGSGEVDRVLAEQVIQAALGQRPAPAADAVRLTVTMTLILVDLLVDERLSAAQWRGFRDEAVGLALSVEPDLDLGPGAAGPVERDCDG